MLDLLLIEPEAYHFDRTGDDERRVLASIAMLDEMARITKVLHTMLLNCAMNPNHAGEYARTIIEIMFIPWILRWVEVCMKPETGRGIDLMNGVEFVGETLDYIKNWLSNVVANVPREKVPLEELVKLPEKMITALNASYRLHEAEDDEEN